MKAKCNIKVELKDGFWMTYTDVKLIESLEDYKEHMVELDNKFKVSKSEIENNKTWIGHGHSTLTGIAGMWDMPEAKEERGNMLANLTLLHGSLVANQLKEILEGKKLVVNKVGGYFSIKEGQAYEILNTPTKKYTEDDIKINKWWGGSHYYAKVGTVDVVDEDGNCKWNARWRAKEEAMRVLDKLNRE